MTSILAPLRLEWTLASPVAGLSYPLHLDGVVAWALTERALREGGLAPATKVRDIASELPFARCVRGSSWCWQASALIAQDNRGISQRIRTRRTDVEDLAARIVARQVNVKTPWPLKPYAVKIDTARGQLKNDFEYFAVRHIERMVAWCVGDPDYLVELLAPEAGLVTGLGKRVHEGFGRIGAFSITTDASAETSWEKRFLPWHKDGYVQVQASHHPPYWAIENRTSGTWAPAELFA